MIKHRTRNRTRLMIGASMASITLAGAPVADAQDNPFTRSATSPAAHAAQASISSAEQAAIARANTQQARAALLQAVAARQAMDRAQTAARAAALVAQSQVPNGLTAGGLQVDPAASSDPSKWINAKAPIQQTGSDGRTTVTVEQTGSQAILNWQTFNVGRETDLTFKQGANNWVVLNRVTDPDANPSQILGSITAPGTVLVLNRNGVIFGGASQVNVGSLLAAAANRSDSDFLSNGIYSLQSGAFRSAFSDVAGGVRVEAGARIETAAPKTVLEGGGYVILLGGTVENAGTITTPEGQTLLAAGDNFALRTGVSTSANQLSTTRGVEAVTRSAANSANGIVTNLGAITATQGDITLTGRTVTQGGVLISTSSVNQRGTIHLSTSRDDTRASVTIGADSYTAILPEVGSAETALNTQRDALIADSATVNSRRGSYENQADPFNNRSLIDDRKDLGRIEIVSGKDVTFAEGSLTQAQGAQVAVEATGAVTVAAKATIDVSGVRDVALDVADNNLKINVQGFELRDSPLNRDAQGKPLFSQNLWVDARDLVYVPAGTNGYDSDRYYTPGGLIEASGYLGTTPHKLGEWNAIGGKITFRSASLEAQAGSVFDIAGGNINYAGGYLRQSLLQGTDGKLYTAGNAPAGMEFVSVGRSFQQTYDRWGSQYTETYQSPYSRTSVVQWEDGYTVGRSAGTVAIQSVTARFDGTILADVITGEHQTSPRATSVADPYKLGQNQAAIAGGLNVEYFDAAQRTVGASPADIYLTDAPVAADAPPAVYLNLDTVTGHGLGALRLASQGNLVIDGPVTLANGGSLAAGGNHVSIGGDIVVRGGSVEIVAGSETLEIDDVTIDTRGLWSNLALDPDNVAGLAFVDGGAISISGYSLKLGADVRLDASAGGVVLPFNETRGGDGGDISLSAYQDLTLGGTIRSYGFTHGGALTLRANVTIGGTGLATPGLLGAGEAAPIELVADADVVLPTGTVLPFALPITITAASDGDTIPVGTQFTATLANPIVIGPNGWVVPDSFRNVTDSSFPGYVLSIEGPNFFVGSTIPAGYHIYGGTGRFNAAYVVPAGTFAGSAAITPRTVTYPTGTVLQAPLTIPAGAIIPRGATLPFDVAVRQYSNLDPSFFQSGFSAYNIYSSTGLSIRSGTNIDVVQPVLQFTADSLTAPTGSNATDVAALVLPELFAENPRTGEVTQRAGASVTFGDPKAQATIYGPGLTPAGSFYIGEGASLTVDPGQSVAVGSTGQITIDGRITAHGGRIELLNSGKVAPTAPTGLSVWVGNTGVLDASGIAHVALDLNGHRYGKVLDGGSITLGARPVQSVYTSGINATPAFVVVRSGAVLDVSGASAELDFATPASLTPKVGYESLLVASDGGAITLNSSSGILLEKGSLLRGNAGGTGASGGSLAMYLEAPVFVGTDAEADAAQKVARELWIDQSAPDTTLPPELQPGVADSGLTLGLARISADQIEQGGFDSLNFFARSGITFNGDVALSAGRSITLNEGPIFNSSASGKVSLVAPYVLLDGRTTLVGTDPEFSAYYIPLITPDRLAGGNLSISADLVDVRNSVDVRYAQTDLVIAGDLRFLQGFAQTYGSNERRSLLGASGDLSVVADRIYPVSGARGVLSAGTSPGTNFIGPFFNYGGAGSTLTIASNAGSLPATPYSAFGELTIAAATIEQGGHIYAPFGSIVIGNSRTNSVTLLKGGTISTSGAGLVMPYGGTLDGITYRANGGTITTIDAVSGYVSAQPTNPVGVTIEAASLVSDAGSVIDVSGGGTLLGAAFVTGRGGSVDTLLYPRTPGGQVYAIVPGVDTAPVTGGYASEWTGASPGIGQQITIPDGVPGLPAGTYTLLPANYALIPGAFRVELGGQIDSGSAGVTAYADGSYGLGAYQGIAGTDIRDVLPTGVTIADGATLRSYANYNEQSYGAFQVASASVLGTLRNRIEADGQALMLNLGGDEQSAANSALSFAGEARFAAAKGGHDGSLSVTTRLGAGNKARDLIITGAGSTTINTATSTTVAASQIDAIGAPQLYLGGTQNRRPAGNSGLGDVVYGNLSQPNSNPNQTIVEGGVTLNASHIGLIALKTVRVDSGAVISTLGTKYNGLDSRDGLRYGANNYGFETPAFMLVSNGLFDFNAPNSRYSSNIVIQNGASLYSEASIGFYSNKGVDFGRSVNIGTRNLSLSVGSINIGTDAALDAVGTLPAGLALNQNLLDRLLKGDPASGAPALERLALNANDAINFFGTVELNTLDPVSGKSLLGELVFNSPAIYGYGSASDQVRLITDTLVWNGGLIPIYDQNYNRFDYVATDPGARIDGLGAGGSFTVDAARVVFGYPEKAQVQTSLEFDRLMLGFGKVTFNASDRIVANARGTVSIYESGGPTGGAFDPATYAGSGGVVSFVTPLVTSEPAAQLTVRTGSLAISTANGTAPSTATSKDLGGQLTLIAHDIDLATAIVLPSGRLTLRADGDINLRSGARVDLSGQTIQFFDVAKYSWGGDISLTSTNGNILMDADALIDVSAAHSDGGSIAMVARGAQGGRIQIDGTLKGSGSGADDAFDGGFLVSARVLGDGTTSLDSAFAKLNQKLTDGGLFYTRSFAFGEGNLTVGSEVRARNVTIATDGGSLTVAGTIDASGKKAGAIRLSARDDLVIGGGGVLDLHGTLLDVDGRGVAIEATNRGNIELTSRDGWVRIGTGARFDLTSPDAVDRGRIEINAGRQTETSGLRVDASGTVAITGAASVAVNGFWTYTPTDAQGTVMQDTTATGAPAGAVGLNQIDAASRNYYSALLGDTGVQQALSGLRAYGSRYHLRPGVEIVGGSSSNGNLRVLNDLDLAGYRYGSDADRNPLSANYGAGEPLSLLLRAPGDLTINGSITDGFGKPISNPDEGHFRDRPIELVTNIQPGVTLDPGATQDIVTNFTLAEDWVIPADWEDYNPDDGLYGLYAKSPDMPYGQPFYPGDTIPVGYSIIYANYYSWHIPHYVPAIDLGSIRLPQAPIYAIAPMLTPGMLSATMRLVSGADLGAADSRTVQSSKALGTHGDMILDDFHVHKAQYPYADTQIFSVIRTGTGNLDLVAGGDFTQKSLFGIYTAGTDSPLAVGEADFHLDRGKESLGDPHFGSQIDPTGEFEATLANWQLYFPDHGGDLLLSVGGDLTPFAITSDYVEQWLWRQGAPELGQKTAWGINFGTYVRGGGDVTVAGFSGIGTLGGGNVSVDVGGNAGFNRAQTSTETGGLNLTFAVGSTGRVTSVTKDGDSVTGGTLVQTGGGDLSLRVRGGISAAASSRPQLSFDSLTNTRGDLDVSATSIGGLQLVYGERVNDPRPGDPLEAGWYRDSRYPMRLTLGDSSAQLRTSADLLFGTFTDAGANFSSRDEDAYLFGGITTDGTGRYGMVRSWFSLATDNTGIDLFSLGGNIIPLGGGASLPVGFDDPSLPSHFTVTAAGGSIYNGITSGSTIGRYMMQPSPTGQLELLAQNSIVGSLLSIGMSGMDVDYESIPNPFKPAYILGYYGDYRNPFQHNTRLTITVIDGTAVSSPTYSLYAFDPNTPAHSLHAGDPDPSHVYAVDGDITTALLQLAEATRVRAGRDIVRFGGTSGYTTLPSSMVHSNVTDLSSVTAGRDIIYADVTVAGPGTLEVTAGRNIYLADQGSIVSTGAIADGDRRPGASILLGAGLAGPGADYEAMRAYLDPANELGVNPQGQPFPLEGSGKVVHVYDEELILWLGDNYGFKGNAEQALAFFDALPAQSRQPFLREVFYAELTAGGREFNDPESARFGSYLRGRNAIAALFPTADANGKPIAYAGDITLFGKSGLRTLFGGNIQLLAPGGRIVAGLEGIVPPASAGIITQGAGDVQSYSSGSLLLGLSRVLTTFGGDIVIWSAEGDINAGRGSKTSVLFTPPRLTYDLFGDIALSPQVPTTGAGVGTLNPIPEVKPGNVDLIAPLGTVDAGEAGIRVSGDLNIAALHVVNAANIDVQGEATGLPAVAAVNSGALTSASNAASAVSTEAERLAEQARPKPVPVDIPSIVTGRFVGFGDLEE